MENLADSVPAEDYALQKAQGIASYLKPPALYLASEESPSTFCS